MITKETLSCHYLDEKKYNDWFRAERPVGNSKVLAVLDIHQRLTDRGNIIHIYLPRHILIDKFAEGSSFHSSDGLKLDVRYEPYCRGSRAEIITENALDEIYWSAGDETIILNLSNSDFDFFRGKNTALLVSMIERVDTIAHWIRFHYEFQDLERVCLIRRKEWGGLEPNFYGNLLAQIMDIPVDVMLIETDAPLGGDEAPEESLWIAPDAPGKDRMIEPDHNFWTSPLASAQIYEICRNRFLDHARAITNVDASDLIVRRTKLNIFDEAVNDMTGMIQLYGERVYPWRVRDGDIMDFKEHIAHRFDETDRSRKWIVNPQSAPRKDKVWNLFRVGKLFEDKRPEYRFFRFMGFRHFEDGDPNPTLAPRTSLIRYPELEKLVLEYFDGKPVLPPEGDAEAKFQKPAIESGRRLIVTTMKNEGPFLLEWIAYHKAIGFDDFVIYTNDCTDGTDKFLDLLQERGIVEHYDNPYRGTDLKPQHAALFDAQKLDSVKEADWLVCMDCDEYVNIKVGDGTLDDLFGAVGNANMISMTWRLFGNSDIVKYEDKPIIEQFDHCANEITRFPHQAWGVKTLFRNLNLYKKLGVHRPKGLRPEFREHINWVNGSGRKLPDRFLRNSWRTGLDTYGYDLVQLNHYACRSMESFLVKRDRGRVNHVDRDQGIEYWFRMNHNPTKDDSIKRMIPRMQEMLDTLLSDPEIKVQHEACVIAHQLRIKELLKSENYVKFFEEIQSPRVKMLSRFLPHFGMNVFLIGPDAIPDQVILEIKNGERDYYNPPASMVPELARD